MEEKTEIKSSLTIKDLLAVFKFNWLIIVIITIACTAVGILYNFVLKKVSYSTSGSVIVISNEFVNSSSENDSLSESLLTTYTIKEFISNDVVIDAVADELSTKYDNVSHQDIKNIIRDGLNVSNTTQSLIINISFTTDSNKIADKNAFVVDVVNDVITCSISLLDTEIKKDGEVIGYTYGKQLANRVKKLSSATICTTNSHSILIIIFSFIFGIFVGYVVGLIRYVSKKYKKVTKQ